ncbi:hypothetical protein [Enterococcus gallinarum]|uniref:hypothetical protein n=1 Tax=Enterococcus gallinarum TaxID=1353 RepID=UPI002433629B|nr:hypothetical protein [Enterococcus gallinarum]
MKKICFVLVLSNGLSYTPLTPSVLYQKDTSLKDYFSQFYNVSTNYLRDKDSVDYLVMPDPFVPFDNENNLPIIKVPSQFFLTKDFVKIKKIIDTYFEENDSN